MPERRGSVYSDPDAFEAHIIYPDDEESHIVGLIIGDPFTRNLQMNSPTGNILEIPTKRQVMIALTQDRDGNLSCERYAPELHGEEIDLPTIGLDDFENDEAYASAYESLERVRKGGSSKPRYDVTKKWKESGGDPRHTWEKEVYHENKLR
jgi:hypothetical protein